MARLIPANNFVSDSLPRSKNAGFTIVEMVLAIVVSSVMAIGIVSYIGQSVDAVTSTGNRNQLASAGRTAIDRMAMELHNALPNSIRVTPTSGLNLSGDQCIEFIPVRAASSYVNPPFTSAATLFDVVRFTPSQDGVDGGFAVIYPVRQNLLYGGDNGAYATWPNFPTRRPIQEIAASSGIVASNTANQSTVSLVTPHRFRGRSPQQRFFVVEQPVSFCVLGDKLYRYTDYGFFAAQETEEESGSCVVTTPKTCLPNYAALTASPPRIKTLITDSIDNMGLIAFTISNQTLNRNSLVAIELNFTSEGDTVILNHDILTRIVP